MPATRTQRIAAVGLLLALIGACTAPAISEDELAARVQACRPTWQNYQEDIKGQLGAMPAAEWQGVPIEARCEGTQIHITFRLEAPWLNRAAAVPVLIRDALGGTHTSTQASQDKRGLTYLFEASGEAPSYAAPPWVEIKYPHGHQRITFDPSGRWR